MKAGVLLHNLYRAMEAGQTKDEVKQLMNLVYDYLYNEGLLSDEEPKVR